MMFLWIVVVIVVAYLLLGAGIAARATLRWEEVKNFLLIVVLWPIAFFVAGFFKDEEY